MPSMLPASKTLFYGDNLDVMRKYIKDETVDLCYIDPPFNSKRNYNQIYNNIGGEDRAQAQAFIDTWVWDQDAAEGFLELQANDMGRFTPQAVDLITGLEKVLKKGSMLAYLVSMTIRITEIHRVLKSTGSFYLHCDPTASHYLKLVLDAIFVPNGGDYKNEIVWQRTNARSTTGCWPRLHDVLFYYTKGALDRFQPTVVPADQGKLPHTLITGPDGRKYQTYELTAPGLTQSGESGKPWRGFSPAAMGRHWANTQTTMNEWDDLGLIHWPKGGGFPRRRAEQVFVAENRMVTVGDVWTDIDRINQTAKERLGYPTQKPESLLERIITASTSEGDMILDAYCGCGTTVAVAERLKRNWIGIDITYQSISLIMRRLEQQYGKAVLDTITLNGIPQDIASARALALKRDDRVRKEFEMWAVLTYTNNRAVINSKKGGDKGIDGTAYFLTGTSENAKMVFQVKSGTVGRGDIAKLNNDRAREGAEIGILLTLQPPTQGMREEASAADQYTHVLMDQSYPRIQIVTIAQIVEQNNRLALPLSLEVLKKAQQATPQSLQTEMFADGEGFGFQGEERHDEAA